VCACAAAAGGALARRWRSNSLSSFAAPPPPNGPQVSPMDVAKTRIQVMRAGSKNVHVTLVGALRAIVQTDGVAGLYAGSVHLRGAVRVCAASGMRWRAL